MIISSVQQASFMTLIQAAMRNSATCTAHSFDKDSATYNAGTDCGLDLCFTSMQENDSPRVAVRPADTPPFAHGASQIKSLQNEINNPASMEYHRIGHAVIQMPSPSRPQGRRSLFFRRPSGCLLIVALASLPDQMETGLENERPQRETDTRQDAARRRCTTQVRRDVAPEWPRSG